MAEEQIRQLVVGKALYLRGGYLDDSLNFDEHGRLIGHSPQGSYTLNLVQIDKVRLGKHKLELQGVRYGLHFLGAMPNEDPTRAEDKVRITPRKKTLKIAIERERVVKPKKIKEKGRAKTGPVDAAESAPAVTAPPRTARESSDAVTGMAAVPESELPAEARSVTTSPAHAAQLLRDALDHVFAQGLDDRMVAAMPSFWQFYYQDVDARTDYRPRAQGVLRQGDVDRNAKLLSRIEPPSNEYAQKGGVAGMALYHAVIGADGKPEEIVVARPIGFGLDENAVDTIGKASFRPALKDGKPVPVLLDLVVQFRIYSKRTAKEGKAEIAGNPAAPALPGPYSLIQH